MKFQQLEKLLPLRCNLSNLAEIHITTFLFELLVTTAYLKLPEQADIRKELAKLYASPELCPTRFEILPKAYLVKFKNELTELQESFELCPQILPKYTCKNFREKLAKL